jgi:hypothetical protein
MATKKSHPRGPKPDKFGIAVYSISCSELKLDPSKTPDTDADAVAQPWSEQVLLDVKEIEISDVGAKEASVNKRKDTLKRELKVDRDAIKLEFAVDFKTAVTGEHVDFVRSILGCPLVTVGSVIPSSKRRNIIVSPAGLVGKVTEGAVNKVVDISTFQDKITATNCINRSLNATLTRKSDNSRTDAKVTVKIFN